MLRQRDVANYQTSRTRSLPPVRRCLNISPNLPSLLLRSLNNNSLKPIDVNHPYPKLELRFLLMVIPLLDLLFMEVFLISLNSLPLPYVRLKKVNLRKRGLLSRRSLSERTRPHHPISQRMMFRNLPPPSLPNLPGILRQLHLLFYQNYLPCRLSRCLLDILLLNPRLRRRGLESILR
jgi:hypothetical protein